MDYVKENIEATIGFAKMLKRQEQAEDLDAEHGGQTSISPMVVGLRPDQTRLVITARPLDIDEDTPLEMVTHEKARAFSMIAWAMRLWEARDVLFLSDSYFRAPDGEDEPLGEVQEEDLELPLSKDPRSTEAIVVAHIQPDSSRVFVTPYHYSEHGIVFEETGLMPHEDHGLINAILQGALTMTEGDLAEGMRSAPGGPFDRESFFEFMGKRGYILAEFSGDMTNFGMKTWMGEGDDSS